MQVTELDRLVRVVDTVLAWWPTKYGIPPASVGATPDPDPSYGCWKCEVRFPTPEDRDIHMCYHHPYIMCRFCPMAFSQRAALRRHELFHAIHRCVCGKQFNTRPALVRHQQLHITEIYRCGLCFRKFRSPSGVRRHNSRVCRRLLSTAPSEYIRR